MDPLLGQNDEIQKRMLFAAVIWICFELRVIMGVRCSGVRGCERLGRVHVSSRWPTFGEPTLESRSYHTLCVCAGGCDATTCNCKSPKTLKLDVCFRVRPRSCRKAQHTHMWRRYLSPPSDPIRTVVARSSATVAHFCVVWRAGHRRVCPDFKVGESNSSGHC